jgi:hypothetical protein
MPVEKTLQAKTLDMLIAESKIPNKKGQYLTISRSTSSHSKYRTKTVIAAKSPNTLITSNMKPNHKEIKQEK